jgi:hypothetical protein
MQTRLNIHGVRVSIDSNEEVASWVKHDYSFYVVESTGGFDLSFQLSVSSYDYSRLPHLTATTYHDDYIVYDNGDIRIIDFIAGGVSVYDTKKKTINIYSQDVDQLYDMFYLSFESLLGEELDKRGFHRIHCLSLDVAGQASLLLLPPGAGKTTLALKFSSTPDVKILSEDMVLYKRGVVHGLHFRWGVRDKSYQDQGRVMRRSKYHDKILLDAKKFSLVRQSSPHHIIIGQRVLSGKSEIGQVSRARLLLPMFKSMVLGLELQQSLAYFLLRNHKDIFTKLRFSLGRLRAMVSIIAKSKTYKFNIGYDIDHNFDVLNEFIKK